MNIPMASPATYPGVNVAAATAPQAAPQTFQMFDYAMVNDRAGLWSHGDCLVMHKYARFPQCCVITNEPVAPTDQVRRFLCWSPPALLLISLLVFVIGFIGALLLYLVFSLTSRQRVEVWFGLSERYQRRCVAGQVLGWLGAACSLGMFYVGGLTGADNLLILALLVFIVTVTLGRRMYRTLRVHKMQGEFMWVKGASRAFLSGCPPWPYGALA